MLKTLFQQGEVEVTERTYSDGSRQLEIGVTRRHYATQMTLPGGDRLDLVTTGLNIRPEVIGDLGAALAFVGTLQRGR